jgi:hypothetical protein
MSVISIFKSMVEEVGGAIARHTKMLTGAKKQVKRSRPQDTVYEVGAQVQVDWPLNDGSTSKCRAVIAERECRPPKRKRAKVSEFRYKLVWSDGSKPIWSRLLHLSHEICTLAITVEFKAAHRIYVEANGVVAWVPEKLAKHEGDDPKQTAKKHQAWLELKQTAKKYRLAYRYLQLPQEDFEELEELGFAWCRNEEKWEKQIVPALVTYKQVHGNLLVPNSMVIPARKPWPKHLWGMKLGGTVRTIRSAENYVRDDSERRQWLDSIGFEWDEHKRQWESVQEALDTYWQEHGDLAVTFLFVVPSCNPWSEKLWGMQLGKKVSCIRSGGTSVNGHPERRQWLEDMGFRFETAVVHNLKNDQRWEKEVVPALMTYKQMHGNLLVPNSLAVPSRKPWPKHLWGMRLGNVVNSIRSSKTYVHDDPERRQWLDSIGFEWDEHKRQWENVKKAFETYLQENGDLAIPRSFAVPSCNPWAQELWGMALGKTVGHIRTRGYFVNGHPERRLWLQGKGLLFKVNLSSAEQMRLAAAHYGRQRIGAISNAAAAAAAVAMG